MPMAAPPCCPRAPRAAMQMVLDGDSGNASCRALVSGGPWFQRRRKEDGASNAYASKLSGLPVTASNSQQWLQHAAPQPASSTSRRPPRPRLPSRRRQPRRRPSRPSEPNATSRPRAPAPLKVKKRSSPYRRLSAGGHPAKAWAGIGLGRGPREGIHSVDGAIAENAGPEWRSGHDSAAAAPPSDR